MTRKNNFFEKCYWFKFNNLELTLVMTSKFYTSVVKGLKLKFRMFWWLIPKFVEVTGEKLVGSGRFFIPTLSWIGLMMIYNQIKQFLGLFSQANFLGFSFFIFHFVFVCSFFNFFWTEELSKPELPVLNKHWTNN